MIVSTTASGGPLKSAASCPGATHGGSTDLDASAIWCRAHEKGDPSSEECAREGLSRGKLFGKPGPLWVGNTSRPPGPAPRPPRSCTVSVRVGSLGETHICVKHEASCVPVHPCRGGVLVGGLEDSVGGIVGRSTWASSNRLQISRIVSGWSPHSPGNVSCHESTSAACLSFPGMWAACSDLSCVWLQSRRWRASCDMRRDRIPQRLLMYKTATVLSVRTNTCLPNSSGRNCHKARCTANSSRQLMCQSSQGPVLSPEAACLLHVAPQSMLEASVVTTTCRDTCSMGTPARRKTWSVQGLKERRHSWVMFTRSVPWRNNTRGGSSSEDAPN